ncbi:MAG: hypothetical protein FJ088_06250, partial [Deltaproteobacteria bacterium]|nr:hypothetical protein [Deltaproteobacteria bacterium]
MKSAAVFCFVFLFVLACGGGGDGGTDQGGKDVPVEVLNDETTDAAEEEILAKETVEETAGETIVETAQEVVHGDSPTGGPCVENKDCFTNFCLTSAVLSQLISP